jgi:hypothetical protein
MIIGGKDRPIKIGINQSIEYCTLRGCTITQMNNDLEGVASGGMDISVLRDFIWSALKDGARVAKQEFDVDTYTVGDWLEELDDQQMEQFFKDLVASMPKGKKSEAGKKKAATVS